MIWFLLGLLPTFIYSQFPNLHPFHNHIHVKDKLVLMHSMNEALLWALLGAVAYFLAKEHRRIACKALGTLYFVNLGMLIGFIFHKLAPGILMNPSMSGCLLVAMTAIRSTPLMMTITGVVVTALMASIPFGMFVILLILRFGKPWVLAVILAMGGVIYAFQPELFYSNGRTELWQITVALIKNMWRQDPLTLWAGSGLGSYFVLAPQFNEWREMLFTHAHSDYLELIFEGGLFSVICFTTAIVSFWRKSLHTGRVVLLMFLIWAIANFPSHEGLSIVIFALIFGVSHGRKTALVPPVRRH